MTDDHEKPTRKQKRAEEGRRLEAAFQRLLAQDPHNPALECDALQEMLEESGHVPVTQDNVALEAGLSRKLITGDCPFKDLARRIKDVRSTHGVKPSTTVQLEDLRRELAETRQTVVVLRSRMAEAVVKADRAETEADEQHALVARLRRQIGERNAA